MTMSVVDDVVAVDRCGDLVMHHFLVGPDDGYGNVSLERLSLAPGPHPWSVPECRDDRLVVVLAGSARVGLDGGVTVTLGPNEVVQVGGGRPCSVEVLSTGAPGSLDLLVLSRRDGTT